MVVGEPAHRTGWECDRPSWPSFGTTTKEGDVGAARRYVEGCARHRVRAAWTPRTTHSDGVEHSDGERWLDVRSGSRGMRRDGRRGRSGGGSGPRCGSGVRRRWLFRVGRRRRRCSAALARADLPWDRVGVWQVDERVAPDGDPDRNANQLNGFPGRHHPMPVTAADLDRAATRYAKTLPERFDVVHLGMGPDGHTASWPPSDPVIDSERPVALSRPYQGRVRMTLTPRRRQRRSRPGRADHGRRQGRPRRGMAGWRRRRAPDRPCPQDRHGRRARSASRGALDL